MLAGQPLHPRRDPRAEVRRAGRHPQSCRLRPGPDSRPQRAESGAKEVTPFHGVVAQRLPYFVEVIRLSALAASLHPTPDKQTAACDAYRPWHYEPTHRSFLRPTSGKCLHYYFYFLGAEFGLIYLRVPTWAPFRRQHRRHRRLAACAGIGRQPVARAVAPCAGSLCQAALPGIQRLRALRG